MRSTTKKVFKTFLEVFTRHQVDINAILELNLTRDTFELESIFVYSMIKLLAFITNLTLFDGTVRSVV